jgi:hypothetical protein
VDLRDEDVMRGTLALSMLLVLGGCWHDPTEIVIVVDSDLKIGADFDDLDFQLGNCISGQCTATCSTLPATLGIVPPSGEPAGLDPEFSVTVTALKGTDGTQVVARGASMLRFVSNDVRALFLPLYRRCECQGTTCPNLADPDCADIDEPVLTEFDEDHIQRLSKDSSSTPSPATAPTLMP